MKLQSVYSCMGTEIMNDAQGDSQTEQTKLKEECRRLMGLGRAEIPQLDRILGMDDGDLREEILDEETHRQTRDAIPVECDTYTNDQLSTQCPQAILASV